MSIEGNWDRRISRRAALGLTGMGALGLALKPGGAMAQSGRGRPGGRSAGYGELVEDPGGLLDLPRGFQYRVISEEGANLSSGKPVPADHDGMAAFQGRGNSTILIRNHELSQGEDPPVIGKNPYDASQDGGTTGIVVGPDRRVVEDYVTSSGTIRNCSGGPTPWDTWLTCEETREDGHGYVFEVLTDGEQKGLSDTPIKEMGFFSHEAIGIDPQTGAVYLTEDGASYLYRFLPNDTSKRPGALQKGGKLQAMAIDEAGYTPGNGTTGQRVQVVWKDIDPDTAPESAASQGAARFSRLEGADFKGGAFWFDDTSFDAIYRYVPATNTLEIFYEGPQYEIKSPDNLVVTPWGDLWFCEDGSGTDRVQGVTPESEVYTFARNALNDSELAGCTFSPDGRTFFVNIQSPGITFAIWGPFAAGSVGPPRRGDRGNRNPGRQRQMAAAAPPDGLAPNISAELADVAERSGMSPLEAVAFDRLGVSLA